jgi:hypothetical protein
MPGFAIDYDAASRLSTMLKAFEGGHLWNGKQKIPGPDGPTAPSMAALPTYGIIRP